MAWSAGKEAPVLKYAIFVEPQGQLAEYIAESKKAIERELPGQPYCADPPHSTLFFAALAAADCWMEPLRSALRPVTPIDADIRRTIVFADDPLTGGGQTLALRVESSPGLVALQRTVADALAPFVLPPPPLAGGMDREPFRTSYDRYGFPFVGEHWIPHFTIASPRVSRHDPMVAQFSLLQLDYPVRIDRVSAWEVEGSAHRRIGTLELGGAEASV